MSRLVLSLLFFASVLLMVACSKKDVDELIYLARTNNVAGVKKILKSSDVDLNARANDGSGQSPIMAATLAGSTEVVKLLLSMNADVSIGEKDGYTPFHGAGFQGRAEIASLLIGHGLDPNDMHKDGFTPLHRAAWGGEARHTEFVQVLLSNGVDPATKSRDGRTALLMTNNDGTKKVLENSLKKAKKLKNTEL